MLVFADTVDGPSAVERSPLRRNLLIATTAAGVAVRPSPLAPRPSPLAPSPLERAAASSALRLRLQPRGTYGCSLKRLRLQVGLLLSLLKLLLHLPFLALLLPLAAVAGALSTQARPRGPALPHDHHATPIAPHRLPHTACTTPLAPHRLQTASDAAVGIAWDSAGVTTGEVTTPLILALGLGVAKATMAPEGFGLLALASLGPVRSSGWRQRLVRP